MTRDGEVPLTQPPEFHALLLLITTAFAFIIIFYKILSYILVSIYIAQN